MATPRDKYYTEFFSTITYCNDYNCAPFSNEKIRDKIHKVIAEEEAGAHNVTVGNFSQTPNTQRENENMILTSEKRDNSDAMVETLKGFTIKNSGYYESDSENTNNAKGDPASDPNVATHNTDINKRKVTDSRNRDLQQKVLSNQTLPIITTEIEP